MLTAAVLSLCIGAHAPPLVRQPEPDPLAAELQRFHTTRADVRAAWGVSLRRYRYLSDLAGYNVDRPSFREAAKAAYRVHQCWDALDDAFWPVCPENRRARLADLREMIGEEAFGDGWMPAP